MSNGVTYYTVAVNQHLVCASPRRYVTEFIGRTCEQLRGYFKPYDQPYGRPRRFPEPLIEIGSLLLEDCPYINYRVPARFDVKMFHEQPVKFEPIPIYQVAVSRNISEGLEAMVRAFRENLEVSI